MAYNPYFPANYQPYPQQQQGILWVQGKVAAQGYPVPAGQSAILMDSDAPYVYKKETALDGRPMPMVTYKLVKEEEVQNPTPVNEDELKKYIRTDQIDQIVTDKVEEIVRDEVERRLSEFSFKPTRKRSTSTED
jgi:hypothetical protein